MSSPMHCLIDKNPIETLYEIYEEIGSGHFAVVRRCIEKSSRCEFAAKYVKKRKIASSRRGLPYEIILREVDVLRTLGNHPNIISLHHVFDNGQYVILVLELVRGGELFEHISEKENLSEYEASLFIKQILEGVSYMHSKCLVHLDLKPENVLLISKNHHHIKLIDFGLSRMLVDDGDECEILGTEEFIAPEIVNYEPLCKATDMWAIGVITYILLCGTSPFIGDTKQHTYSNISAVEYSLDADIFPNTSEMAKDFIAQLLIRNPRNRLSASEALNHSWINPLNETQETQLKTAVTNIGKFKSYQARTRWKHSIRIISLCNRMSRSAKLRSQSGEFLDAKASTRTLQEDKDASFVLSAIAAAIEEKNVAGLEKLFNVAQHIDVNMSNKHAETALHLAAGVGQLASLQFLVKKGGNVNCGDSQGDTPLHWAARQGHSTIVAFLIEQGAQINVQNKHGESCLHIACRYGHTVVVQNLCQCNMNIDLQDDHGETALHVAVWHGFPQIVHHLCSASANTELCDKESQMALHVAASRGNTECLKSLISAGACIEPQDGRDATPLHLALKRQHVSTAMILLHSLANTDIADEDGEAGIHIVAREGLLTVAQTLCAFGCSVDQRNKSGLYPLHIAAKNGHTEIVRCLCLAGAPVGEKSSDGILAEVSAMAQGFDDIAQLLNRLRNEQQREEFIQQLIPTSTCLPRIKVKLLGHSGRGKTKLVEALKAGYFSSFFRRTKSQSGALSPNSNTTTASNAKRKQVNTCSFEMEPTNKPQKNPLQFCPSSESGTKGIDIQQVSISGIGDLSLWEFSGNASYFSIYDYFIGNPACVHLIVFSFEDPFHEQLQQCSFWLSFLQARIPPVEPLGYRGKSSKPCHVALVGTHPDVAHCRKNAQGEYHMPQVALLQEKLASLYGDVYELHDSVFVIDSMTPGSSPMKNLKNYISNLKVKLTLDIPRVTGFMNALVSLLPEWRASLEPFPVVPWHQFVDVTHERINPLAGEEHLREVVTQLQLLGEVVYLKAIAEDLVILDPAWLTTKQVGHLLSAEYGAQARVTGCYTVDDFQMSFPDCDALDLLQVLETIHLCTQCENDGEIEYEFPCFNKVETLDGLWDRSDERYIDGVYSGMRLKSPAPTPHLLPPIYLRIQVQLRRLWQEYPECDTDLYQWHGGSKFCSGPLEAFVSLEEGGETIEVKGRAPKQSSSILFFFLEDLLAMIDQVMVEMCPGLILEKHVLSVDQLKDHAPSVFAWPPADVFTALLQDGIGAQLTNPVTEVAEELNSLLCLQSKEVVNSVYVARDIHVSNLNTITIQKLACMLDPTHPRGADWCVLAVKLNMQNILPSIDSDTSNISPTTSVINAWGQNANSTIGELTKALKLMEREDAVIALVTGSPLYLLSNLLTEESSDTAPASTASVASTSNVSR